MPTIEDLNQNITSETTNRVEEVAGVRDRQDQDFTRMEERLMGRIKNLEQMIQGDTIEDEEYDLVRPYDRDISAETRPQMSAAGLSQHNKHLSQLSNHELHQMKSLHEKDHRKEVRTVLDESLESILDKTINFLVHSIDSYTEKIYEAELMANIHSEDKGYYTRFRVHLMAMIIFIRDDQNILYIGFLMIFLSIIIYFINIITTV
jgi:hypothetical protein